MAGDTDVTIWSRPCWTLPLEKPQKVSFMMAVLRGSEGGGSLKAPSDVCRKFSCWFLYSKSTPDWKVDVRRVGNADLASVSRWLHHFVFISSQPGTPPCVSLRVRHGHMGQVWFSPIYFFFIALQFQRNTSPVFEQVKTSGWTWANRVNPSTYFSKQSPVQRCPTAACRRSVHQPAQSLQ